MGAKGFKFIVILSIALFLFLLYSYLAFGDTGYIITKCDQRFALDGEQLDISLQFKELNLFYITKTDSQVKIRSSDFYIQEGMVKELIIVGGDKTKTYKNVRFEVYSNSTNEFKFINPSNKKYDYYIRFASKPDDSKVNLKLTKRSTGSGVERYELDLSNLNYNNTWYSFVNIPEDEYNSFNLRDSEIIITSGQDVQKIHVSDGRIEFYGSSRIHFKNLSNIYSFNVSEIGFDKDDTTIYSLNFTGGFGTFALGQSHFQFASVDEIQIVNSEKNNTIELKIDPIRKTFKASGEVSSLKFNDQETILPIYQVILRDPTFIAAIVGAIVGGLIAGLLSRKS